MCFVGLKKERQREDAELKKEGEAMTKRGRERMEGMGHINCKLMVQQHSITSVSRNKICSRGKEDDKQQDPFDRSDC